MWLLYILLAFVMIGALGFVFGGALAYADKVFAVPKDDRLDEITAVLPDANCGGCGYVGCAGFAQALADGEANVAECSVIGEKQADKIADILGVERVRNVRVTTLVRCNGGARCEKKFQYIGEQDCLAASFVAGGPLECKYGCIGLGSCVKACAFDALSIVDGVAVVDHEKCTGCLKCVKACPRDIIVPVSYGSGVSVLCASHERGNILSKICKIGCLGCRICVNTCKYDAIHVEENLASIDYDKCVGCGECAEKCPRGLIKNLNVRGAEEEGQNMEKVGAADSEEV